jgi:hypothetical protein
MPMLHLDQLNHRWVSRFLVARIEDKNHEAFRLQPHPYLDALPPYVNSDPALDPTIFSSYKKIIIGGIRKDHIRGEIRKLGSRNS